MNKEAVNKGIPVAYEALEKCKIAKDGKIQKSYRGQIATFGAAVTTGSLQAAVAFFSDKGSAEVDREKISDAILYVLQKENIADGNIKTLWDYVDGRHDGRTKEEIVNAAISLKLAMNLYELV